MSRQYYNVLSSIKKIEPFIEKYYQDKIIYEEQDYIYNFLDQGPLMQLNVFIFKKIKHFDLFLKKKEFNKYNLKNAST